MQAKFISSHLGNAINDLELQYHRVTPSGNQTGPTSQPRAVTSIYASSVEEKIHALRINFDGDFQIEGRPLIMRPDRPTKGGTETGLRVWDCGIMLAKYIDRNMTVAQCSGLKVVEVGCGTGIAGLSLALKGADVTLTDLPSVECRTNDHIALNADNIAAAGGSACFKLLDWRKLGVWDNSETYDWVLAADCVWHHSFINDFTKALVLLCNKDPSRTRVLFGHKLRSSDLNEPLFEHLRKNSFTIQKVNRELLHPDYLNAKSDVYVLQLQEAVQIPSF
mmetsp:Transcript_23797/g.42866  ORF Transcript_23797/g.42866 Transcript_23797/m.42866 type:complete len:278 (-) Transcript_23797:1099-1932(-)